MIDEDPTPSAGDPALPTGDSTSPAGDSATWTGASRARARSGRGSLIGVLAALILIVVAIIVPPSTGWDVKALSAAPLFAELRPRIGPGSAIALVIAAVVLVWGPRLTGRLRWWPLLSWTTLVSAAWMLALDAVDGFDHLGGILNSAEEYLPTARALADVGLPSAIPDLLSGYVARIPLAAADNLPVHLAGHPPGAVLFFALLVAVGVRSAWGIGLVITVLAATIPAAVMWTLRSLGAEAGARSLAPFLASAPAAIWLAVSADAVFASTGAWAIAVLAWSTMRSESGSNRPRTVVGGLAAGVLLGLGAYSSYGFPLLVLVVLAVFAAARTLRPLSWLIVGGLAVVALFTAGGFYWWEAYPVLRERYWDGFAASRPAGYWLWANLAALLCATGPALGAGLTAVVPALRSRLVAIWNGSLRSLPAAGRKGTLRTDATDATGGAGGAGGADGTGEGGRWTIGILSAAAVGMVIAADLSSMSRAEVERIWLFMVPWLLVSLAAVPVRARSWLLSTQLVFALVLAHLVHSSW